MKKKYIITPSGKRKLDEAWADEIGGNERVKKSGNFGSSTTPSGTHPYHDIYMKHGYELKHNTGFVSVYQKEHKKSTGEPYVAKVSVVYPYDGKYTQVTHTHHKPDGKMWQSGTNYRSREQLESDLSKESHYDDDSL